MTGPEEHLTKLRQQRAATLGRIESQQAFAAQMEAQGYKNVSWFLDLVRKHNIKPEPVFYQKKTSSQWFGDKAIFHFAPLHLTGWLIVNHTVAEGSMATVATPGVILLTNQAIIQGERWSARYDFVVRGVEGRQLLLADKPPTGASYGRVNSYEIAQMADIYLTKGTALW